MLRYDLGALSEGRSGNAGNIRSGVLSAAPEIIACLTFPLVFPFLLHFYLIVLSVVIVGAEALVLF